MPVLTVEIYRYLPEIRYFSHIFDLIDKMGKKKLHFGKFSLTDACISGKNRYVKLVGIYGWRLHDVLRIHRFLGKYLMRGQVMGHELE